MAIEIQRSINFIQRILINPPRQVIEEAASESHETRRLPDPWVYIDRNGKLITPEGRTVEEKVEKKGYLGKAEFKAFRKIQKWCSQNNSGIMVWFSPPFPGNEDRPALKIMISEIINLGETKVLFNRAVVLDVDTPTLLDLANDLTESKIENPEFLRSNPFFPSNQEFKVWFEKLSEVTSQTELIRKGEDLRIKNRTYRELEKIRARAIDSGRIPTYGTLYQEANRRGLIGKYAGSCGGRKTAFEALLENSSSIKEGRTLKCTCPFCREKVSAIIREGKIHCPKCGKSAPYHC